MNYRYIGNFCILFLISLIFNISIVIGYANEEYIKFFKSYIKVNKDRTINIKEQIHYFFPKYKHGIKRFFPVYYKDPIGNDHRISFNVNSVLKDDQVEPYKVYNKDNLKVIMIGDPSNMVIADHIYYIDYKIDDQLYFPKNNYQLVENQNNLEDLNNLVQLYFQAIPPQHNIVIERAIVEVELPPEIKKDEIKFEAYFGTSNPKNENYFASVENHNIIKFTLTKALQPGERFSIVVGWPQGYINPPSYLERLQKILLDNFYLIVLLLGLFLLITYSALVIRRINLKIKKATIIPLFYPPDNMLPSMAGCIYKCKYSDVKLFASEIVNMAVNNLLKIEFRKTSLFSFFNSKSYVLIKNPDVNLANSKNFDLVNDKFISKEHQIIFNILFSKSDTVEINSQNSDILSKAQENLSYYLKVNCVDKYFDYHEGFLIIAIVFSALNTFFSLYFNFTFISLGLILLYVLVLILFSYLIFTYNQQGQKLLEQIKGFKQFLSVTESERFKVIGTPPDKNPELYEKYLPYAIALGVEQEWSKQFVPVFSKIKNYEPSWTNVSFDSLSSINFYANLGSALFNSISNYRISNYQIKNPVPGSISGFGDKGKSGGGGGGGFESW